MPRIIDRLGKYRGDGVPYEKQSLAWRIGTRLLFWKVSTRAYFTDKLPRDLARRLPYPVKYWCLMMVIAEVSEHILTDIMEEKVGDVIVRAVPIGHPFRASIEDQPVKGHVELLERVADNAATVALDYSHGFLRPMTASVEDTLDNLVTALVELDKHPKVGGGGKAI